MSAKDPYEVLGVSPGASMDEVKKAYKDLARKYHPDKYANNPLSELAEEKMREINEAYDTITKGGTAGSGAGGNSGYGGFGGGYGGAGGAYGRGYGAGFGADSEASMFASVRIYIQNGNIANADNILSQIKTRNAEWYFLKGVVYLRQGRVNEGTEYVNRAAQMDPTNSEYVKMAQNLNNAGYDYRRASVNSGYGTADSGCGPCGFCETLLCANLCCNCLGGGC